jgi:hypothetical protein
MRKSIRIVFFMEQNIYNTNFIIYIKKEQWISKHKLNVVVLSSVNSLFHVIIRPH